MASPTPWDMSLNKLQETEEPGMLQSTGLQRVRHDLATKQQQRCRLFSVSSNNQRATWWQLSSGPWIINYLSILKLKTLGSLLLQQNYEKKKSSCSVYWRRKWQPTPVFLPGESQGRGSLVGCCLWGCTESDTTEAT